MWYTLSMDPIKLGGKRPPPLDVENIAPDAKKSKKQEEVHPSAIFLLNEAQKTIFTRFQKAVHEENAEQKRTLLDLVYSVKALPSSEKEEINDFLSTVNIPLFTDFVDLFDQVTEEENDTVHALVNEHLNPYISGEITPENEDKTRAALITSVFAKFRKLHPRSPLSSNQVEDRVLDAYFYQAASHLNRQFGVAELQGIGPSGKVKRHFQLIDPDLPPSFAAALSVFYSSLEHAIQIDFPEKKLSLGEIREKADATLRDIIDAAERMAPIAATE